MEWRRTWEKEDEEKDEKDDVRCWREWGRMASSIWDFIQVTVDCPGMNKDGFVPILDLKCRMEVIEDEEGMEYNQIIWRFYEKPMNSPYCIMERSAMPEKVKITTMVQEVIRRLRNCHKVVPESEVREELSKFAEKMKRSGYAEKTRKMVIIAGKKGFETMKREGEAGIRRMYRTHEEGKERRWAKKLGGKTSWYNCLLYTSPSPRDS